MINEQQATLVDQSSTAFWLEQRRNPGGIIANGNHYRIGPDDSPMRGFGGRRWIVRFADGRVVETRNLWHQGEIPDRFRMFFPDNATLESA